MWWHSTSASIVRQHVNSIPQVANVRCSCHTFATRIASWPFLPFFFTEPPKLQQKEYRALVRSHSQISSEMLNRALAWLLKDINRVVSKPLFCYFGLLTWWKRNIFQSGPERCRAGYHHQGCLKDVHCCLPSALTILPVSAAPQDNAATTTTTLLSMDGVGQVMRNVWIPPDIQYVWHSGQRYQTLSHHTREFCFSWTKNPWAVFLTNSRWVICVLLRSGLFLIW